jgi:hypothetical protein
MVSDQLLVGSHTIFPLQLTSSTMIPQVTHVFAGSSIINQAPIGTSLSASSSPSLPPGYNVIHSSITNHAQSPSGGSNLFVPLGYHVASGFVPTPT